MLKDGRVTVSVSEPLRLLAIGDVHAPWADESKLRGCYALAKELKPTHIVQVGDEIDSYSFSRFARSLNVTTPAKELEDGRKQAGEMWRRLQQAAPKAKCYGLCGNHSLTRLQKRIMDKAPEFESLLEKPLSELVAFPGVTKLLSHRSELKIGNVLIVHGWGTKLGQHRDYFSQNVITGHSHVGGVAFKAVEGGSIWELNAGFVADIHALPLQYGETTTSRWVAGAGFVDAHGPRFISL